MQKQHPVKTHYAVLNIRTPRSLVVSLCQSHMCPVEAVKQSPGTTGQDGSCAESRTILDVVVKRKHLVAVKDQHNKVTSNMYYTPTKWNTYFCLNNLGFSILKM